MRRGLAKSVIILLLCCSLIHSNPGIFISIANNTERELSVSRNIDVPMRSDVQRQSHVDYARYTIPSHGKINIDRISVTGCDTWFNACIGLKIYDANTRNVIMPYRRYRVEVDAYTAKSITYCIEPRDLSSDLNIVPFTVVDPSML